MTPSSPRDPRTAPGPRTTPDPRTPRRPLGPRLSRRQSLAALPVLGTGVALGTASALSTAPATAAPAPVRDVPRGTMGATIGSFTDDGSNLDRLLQDLDDVVALGGTGIRLNMGAGHLVGHWNGDDGDSVTLRESAVAQMHTLLDGAAERGLLVYLIYMNHYDINPADDHEPSDEVWLRKTSQWWRAISQEFAPKAAVVQVFNEASGSHYRRPVSIPEDELPAYLEDYRSKIEICRDIVHEADPDVLVTTNLYGWPVGDAREEIWHRELDVIADTLDLITVDAFVDWNDVGAETLNGLLERVARLEETYGKQVAIGEIGVSTGDLSQTVQADRLQIVAEILAGEESTIYLGFLFQLRDTNSYSVHESSFGVLEIDGTPKEAFGRLRETRLS